MNINFKTELTLSDISSIVSTLILLTGTTLAYFQWKKNILFKKAEYVNELTEKIRTDEDIKNVIYILEYDETWYNNKFHGSKFEVQMDKTLSYFSYICYLGEKKLLSKEEFQFFNYELVRIIENLQLQDYFYNLYHFSQKNKTKMTFEYLFDYGKKNKVFDKDFFSKNSWEKNYKYHRYINF